MTGAMPEMDEQPIKSGTLNFVNAKTCKQHLRYVDFVKEQHAVHGGVAYYLRTYKSQKDAQAQKLVRDQYKLTRERFCGVEIGYRIVEKQMGLLTRTACIEEEEHMFIITRDYTIMIQLEDCRNPDGEDLESWADVIKQEMGVKGSWPVSGNWKQWPKHVTLHLTEDYLTLVKHAPPTYLRYYRLEDLQHFSQLDGTSVSLSFASTLQDNDLKIKLESHHIKSFLALLSQHATLASQQTNTPKNERYTKVKIPATQPHPRKQEVPKQKLEISDPSGNWSSENSTCKSPEKPSTGPKIFRKPPTPPALPSTPPVLVQGRLSDISYDSDEEDMYDINSLVKEFASQMPMEDVYRYVNGHIGNSVMDDQNYALVRRMTQKTLTEAGNAHQLQSGLHRNGKFSKLSYKSCEDLTRCTVTEEIYWTNITRTLDQVLRNKPPHPDTLKLPYAARSELCIRLYTINPMEKGWQHLGDMIGLTYESINLVDHFIQSQRIHESAAEIVLRHWQYTYNRKSHSVPCTREQLIIFLEEMGRHDLVNIVQRVSR